MELMDGNSRMKIAGLNSFQLKCIAIVFMTIDHLGVIFSPGQLMFRYMGRLSFPIFCFLLVEGFYHSNNLKSYLLRLGLFAVISEIPYDLAFHKEILEMSKQNVFFTLALALFCMCMLEQAPNRWVGIIYILLAMWAAEWFHLDYGFRGILLVMIFYSLRELQPVCFVGAVLWNFIRKWKIQGYGAFAMIPISLYNGKRGSEMKLLFYMYYPVHLLVFAIIREFV